ncbi:MAG TPA: SulP family inorganic anion transporter [Methanospirillum sp.]|nr:SulP family inorganic anion transporter [Methanospirillum sp.]
MWDLLCSYLPILSWYPGYSKLIFKEDLIAGITLTAFAVPELLAYAQLAGLPPVYGLYAGIIAPIVYCLFGTIRQLSIGPSSSEAILTAALLGTIAGGDISRYVSLAALTVFLVGIIAILARVLQLGFIVHLISATVLKGFLAGIGIVIIGGQLFKVFGIPGIQNGFFEQIGYLITHLDETNLPTLLIGLGAILLLSVAGHRFHKLPIALLVVILSIFLMRFSDLPSRGVAMVGTIPGGLPGFMLPDLNLVDIQLLLPLAFAVFLLAYVEQMSIGYTLSKKFHYRVDPDQELLALGATSIMTGLFQGFPVSGSFSRTALNEQNNARTLISGVLSAVLIGGVALFLTSLFYYMPEAVIGSLIIVAVAHLVDIKGLIRIARIRSDEFFIALATCSGVLLFGILSGIFLGVILSILDILYRVSSPRIAILGRIPGTSHYGDTIRHPENQPIEGVLIIRVDAPLIFANAEVVKERIDTLVHADSSIRLVILDMITSPIIDIQAADMMVDLYRHLQTFGVDMKIAEATWQVRQMLRLSGVEEDIGEEVTHTTSLDSVLRDWNCSNPKVVVCSIEKTLDSDQREEKGKKTSRSDRQDL